MYSSRSALRAGTSPVPELELAPETHEVLNRATFQKNDLLHVLAGVKEAAKPTKSDTDGELVKKDSYGVSVKQWLEDVHPDPKLSTSAGKWRTEASKAFTDDGLSRSLFDLILAVALLRDHSRKTSDEVHGITGKTDHALLDAIWELLRSALTGPTPVALPVQRSAQGFLSIALCHHNVDGRIKELFRVHVWLPDGQRGVEAFRIHSHQCWGRSWILAGTATDHRVDVEALEEGDVREPTHETMRLDWGKGSRYTTDQKVSLARADGAGKLVFATERLADKETHGLDDSYCVPTMDYHYTEAPLHDVHATLFFFDGDLGYTHDAPILGPVGATLHPQARDPMGNSAVGLVDLAHAQRSLDVLKNKQGREHKGLAWGHAQRAITNAVYTCGALRGELLGESAYLHLVLKEPWKDSGLVGPYDGAPEILEELLRKTVPSQPRQLHIALQGELGSMYRRMGRLEDAGRAFQTQYDWARALDWQRGQHHAAGELGNVLLQRAQKNDRTVLAKAVALLSVSVEGLRSLKVMEFKRPQETAANATKLLATQAAKPCEPTARAAGNPDMQAEKTGDKGAAKEEANIPKTKEVEGLNVAPPHFEQLDVWEAFGRARLARCYTALGEHAKARSMAQASLKLADVLRDLSTATMVRELAEEALREAPEEPQSAELPV
ncbi:hypothetical protein C8Q77DRAFT_1160694 [Trametes polyzona]|nr:hypothetical protein C8Q77DRAFT_1160694 [Trametes polyzona]